MVRPLPAMRRVREPLHHPPEAVASRQDHDITCYTIPEFGRHEALVMTDGVDPELLLGNLALETRLITKDQLRVALGDQSRDLDLGRAPRQLGVIFLARGYISEDQLLGLLKEQAERRARRKGPGGL